jgi:DNA-binding LacI/PurR family transcriptional regulator
LARVAAQVTLQDLAEKAGVHRSTVSLALRDHPRISKAVRRRVRALAEKMGYRINPLVAALMQSRRSGRAVKHVAIAYVTNYPTRFGWRPPHHDRPDYFPGAEARARELGYKLEHFWMAEPGMTPERLCDILSTRGIHGVLIGRLPPGQSELQLIWDRFSCVALGLTLRAPKLHRVAEDHYSSACRAMDEMAARGLRRIGFVFSEANDSPGVGERWLGAYFERAMRLNPGEALAPFFLEQHEDSAASFGAWLERWKPDGLLVTHAMPVVAWLKKIGRRAPADVGLATLVNDRPERGAAGVFCPAAKLGALAVETVVGLMHRGEVGLPTDAHEVLLPAHWRDGRTLAAGSRRNAG